MRDDLDAHVGVVVARRIARLRAAQLLVSQYAVRTVEADRVRALTHSDVQRAVLELAALERERRLVLARVDRVEAALSERPKHRLRSALVGVDHERADADVTARVLVGLRVTVVGGQSPDRPARRQRRVPEVVPNAVLGGDLDRVVARELLHVLDREGVRLGGMVDRHERRARAQALDHVLLLPRRASRRIVEPIDMTRADHGLVVSSGGEAVLVARHVQVARGVG